MILREKKALAQIKSGESTIVGKTATDSKGYQFVILTNHKFQRVDHVLCDTGTNTGKIERLADKKESAQ